MVDVVVVGSCNVDLVCYTNKMPVPGETILGSNFVITNGGKGANQAVMCSKLGSKVLMVGRIGDDNFGKTYLEKLVEYGIDTTCLLKTENISTGTATIIVEAVSAQNCIIIIPGANAKISVQDVEEILPIYLKQAKVLVVQLEVDPEVTKRSLILAKKAGVITIFNTAPASNSLDKEFYENTDILCCNESESEILTGLKLDIHCTESLRSICLKLLEFGCKCVVLTLGEYGSRFVFASNPGHVYACPCPELKEPIVDTTGAGDAFIGTLAHFISRNYTSSSTLEQLLTMKTVENAIKCASFTVLKAGAQTSYPFISELPDHFFD